MSSVCRLCSGGKCNFVPNLKKAVSESVKIYQKTPTIPEPLEKTSFWVNKNIKPNDDDIIGYHGTTLKAVEEQLRKGKLEQRGNFYFAPLDDALHFAVGAEDPVVVRVSSQAPITDVRVNAFGRTFLPNDPGFKYPVVPVSASKLNPDYVKYRLNPSKREEESLKNRITETTKPLEPLLGCPKVKKAAVAGLALAGVAIALSASTSKAKKE